MKRFLFLLPALLLLAAVVGCDARQAGLPEASAAASNQIRQASAGANGSAAYDYEVDGSVRQLWLNLYKLDENLEWESVAGLGGALNEKNGSIELLFSDEGQLTIKQSTEKGYFSWSSLPGTTPIPAGEAEYIGYTGTQAIEYEQEIPLIFYVGADSEPASMPTLEDFRNPAALAAYDAVYVFAARFSQTPAAE